MAHVTTKGFLIARHLQAAKDSLTEDEFKAIEDELGVTLKQMRIGSFKDFPAELQLAVEERLAPILWNGSYADTAYDSGKLNYKAYAASAVGRTTLLLIGSDPRKMIKATVRLITLVMSGLEIGVEEVDEKKFSLRFRNNPFPPQAWHGAFDGALEATGITPRTKIIEHSPKDVEFLISWD